jgi:hypothetical protein
MRLYDLAVPMRARRGVSQWALLHVGTGWQAETEPTATVLQPPAPEEQKSPCEIERSIMEARRLELLTLTLPA